MSLSEPSKNTPSGIPPENGFPLFSRQQLEVLAAGSIASVFGPLFDQQEAYARQVRMPMPPMLLADRVMRIDAKPGSMGTGTIWTETDVRADAWYLHRDRMPAGLMLEAGQADLLLISWLGIDFKNKGLRVYRLLNFKLTYHGGLPRSGDTLSYEIHIDSHVGSENDLFIFHFDCRIDGHLRLKAIGYAGFFTDDELATSRGVVWDAATCKFDQAAHVSLPAFSSRRTHFSAAQVSAFAQGQLYDCFGPGFELTCTHRDPPRISSHHLQLFDKVTHYDPCGGPWKRGYLRAELAITPKSWFFESHFLNDPCMPGTLMFDGTLQVMAFYLTALGYSIDKDGWHFEPIPGEPWELLCRGQVIPQSKQLTYELFVEELHDEPVPALYAAVLCTVDGLKAFHVRRMGYRLTPAE